jgi:hypothetical protein
MPRPRERVCLQDGLKLDLNRLRRGGFITLTGRSAPRAIQWRSSYDDAIIASGWIAVEVQNQYEGSFRIELGRLDQTIDLRSQPRAFGGRQWYFLCPRTHRYASVLWKPPGASRFCARQTWGRQVAYRSQFLDRDNRAHHGQAKIKTRLIGDLDPDEWDLPPKPKRMRWATYNRYVERYDRYEAMLDENLFALVARHGLLGKS